MVAGDDRLTVVLRAIYRRWVKAALPVIGERIFPSAVKQALLGMRLDQIKSSIREKTPHNPLLWGHKIYSQTDEDGILEFLFSKIGGNKTFVEIGCGNGTENNTHALLLKNWRGVWLDASGQNIEFIRTNLGPDSARLVVRQAFITAANCVETVREGLLALGCPEADLLSLDIDGNDLYVLEKILSALKPSVLCVEYNARFPYPMEVSIAYREANVWQMDDYQGASLGAFVRLAEKHGYVLVSCSVAGTNAFFVHGKLAEKFVVYEAAELYQPPRYFLTELQPGFPATLKFLKDLLNAPSQPPQGR